MQILISGICIEQIGIKFAPLTSTYFTCQQNRGLHKPLTENNNGLNVSQLHMRLWQHSVILKVHHNNSQHHCEIKPQADDHKSGYGQNVDLVFLECRCNFRLPALYLKSFLCPLKKLLLCLLCKFQNIFPGTTGICKQCAF